MSTLVAVLEEARDLGFLGPGPVEVHLDHARAYLAILDGTFGEALDLGTGGGVPGLVLAAERPDLGWTFLDAIARRTAFLERAVASLGLAVTVLTGRAEEAGRRPELRGRHAAVVARSFAAPAVTAECAAPFLAVGGRLVVSEPPEGGDRWPAGGLAELGLGPMTTLAGPPSLAVGIMTRTCPERYPRRTGVPAKRPLW